MGKQSWAHVSLVFFPEAQAVSDASPPGGSAEQERLCPRRWPGLGALPAGAEGKQDTYPSGGWSDFPGLADKATNVLIGFAFPTMNEFICSRK